MSLHRELRLRCLELAVGSGNADPIDLASRFFDFIESSSDGDLNESPVPNDAANKILARISRKCGVPVAAILGRSRSAVTVAARHEAMQELREHAPQMSLSDIGRVFGRDHTSVLHALKKADASASLRSL